MEVNWCKREDTEDKETTEIITKASNASMDIYRVCKIAPALAEPPALLVQCHMEIHSCGHLLFLFLCLCPRMDLGRSLHSRLPSPGAGRADLTQHLLCYNGSELNSSPWREPPV